MKRQRIMANHWAWHGTECQSSCGRQAWCAMSAHMAWQNVGDSMPARHGMALAPAHCAYLFPHSLAPLLLGFGRGQQVEAVNLGFHWNCAQATPRHLQAA